MEDHTKTTNNLKKIGLGYIAITPVLALVLSLIPLHTNATVDLPFLENNQASQVLMFGGFPNCGSTCPLSLTTLQQTYTRYLTESNKNDLQVIFVNINLDTPKDITLKYAQSFHQDFLGYSVKPEDTSSLYKTLSLKTFSNEQDYSSHKGFIYLFKVKNGKWKMARVFNSDVDQKILLENLIS